MLSEDSKEALHLENRHPCFKSSSSVTSPLKHSHLCGLESLSKMGMTGFRISFPTLFQVCVGHKKPFVWVLDDWTDTESISTLYPKGHHRSTRKRLQIMPVVTLSVDLAMGQQPNQQQLLAPLGPVSICPIPGSHNRVSSTRKGIHSPSGLTHHWRWSLEGSKRWTQVPGRLLASSAFLLSSASHPSSLPDVHSNSATSSKIPGTR